MVAAHKRSVAERFWSKVAMRPPWEDDGCWLWTGADTGKGYGGFWDSNGPRKWARAHVVLWRLMHGDPGGLLVMHKCDVRMCVRPSHLTVGTNRDNIRDAASKGRIHRPRGELNAHAVLTVDDVLMIRSSNKTSKALSAELGVVSSCVNKVRAGSAWRHIK